MINHHTYQAITNGYALEDFQNHIPPIIPKTAKGTIIKSASIPLYFSPKKRASALIIINTNTTVAHTVCISDAVFLTKYKKKEKVRTAISLLILLVSALK